MVWLVYGMAGGGPAAILPDFYAMPPPTHTLTLTHSREWIDDLGVPPPGEALQALTASLTHK